MISHYIEQLFMNNIDYNMMANINIMQIIHYLCM